MQTANVLCVCGDTDDEGVTSRPTQTIERLCLEARLRHEISGLSQILILIQPDSKTQYTARSGTHEVLGMQTCAANCVSSTDLSKMLSHGFDRVFLQLATQLSMLSDQLDMADLVAQQFKTGQGLTLFQTLDALHTLLDGATNEVAASTEEMSLLTIAENGCTLCGTCSWVCPTSALRLSEDGETLDVRDSLCTACSICVAACPEQVLGLASTPTLLDPSSEHLLDTPSFVKYS